MYAGCEKPRENSLAKENTTKQLAGVSQDVSSTEHSTSLALVDVANSGKLQLSQQTSSEKVDEIVNKKLSFQGPFPQRLTLFQPPKISSSVQASRQTNAAGSRGSDVELKGFVDVAGIQVLLKIDGKLSAIKEGGRQAGVEVVKIEPPYVTLQRGRHRWKQSLLDL